MRAMNSRGGLRAAMGAAAVAFALAGCGGGGGGTSAPTGGGGGGISSPMVPQPDFTFTGKGTNVVYIDPQGPNSGHNDQGTAGVRRTAPEAETTGLATDQDKSGGTSLDEMNTALTRAATRNNHIATMGLSLQDRIGRATVFTATMESNPATAYIATAPTYDPAASPSLNRTSLAEGASNAANGLVAAAVKSNEGEIGDDEQVCSDLATTTSCIGVNMNQGNWQDEHTYNGRADSSWAVAKLAGYAALLRHAFNPDDGNDLTGADLVGLILGGRNDHNVFSLARAFENGGLAMIGNGARYADVRETESGATADTPLAGWTARALAGPGAAVPVARAIEPGGLGLAAFATPDAGAKRIAGIAASWRGLSWGALVERDGFLGRPSTALLGATDGRWTWVGWSGRKRLGRWDLAAGAEVAFGTADASRSHVVENYGTIVASAWHAEAAYAVGEAVRATLQARQPPRTERARIRLRHNEGVVGVNAGRELRFTASLEEARGWRLSVAGTRHPSHDIRRRTEEEIRATWKVRW